MASHTQDPSRSHRKACFENTLRASNRSVREESEFGARRASVSAKAMAVPLAAHPAPELSGHRGEHGAGLGRATEGGQCRRRHTVPTTVHVKHEDESSKNEREPSGKIDDLTILLIFNEYFKS